MGKAPKGRPSKGKPPSAQSHRLGTYGERVGRERAARRRAARERGEREPAPPAEAAIDADVAVRPEPAARPEAPVRSEAPVRPEGPEVVEIPMSDLANELSVMATLIMAGLARSHPEARRRFRDDGVTVNDVAVLSDKAKLRLADLTSEGTIKLSVGGARHVLLRPV